MENATGGWIVGDWQERAIELKQQGRTYNEIASILSIEYPRESFSHGRVRGWLRRHGHSGTVATHTPATFDLKAELRRGMSLDDIAKKAGASSRVAKAMIDDLTDQGLCIDERDGFYSLSKVPHAEPTTTERDWRGDRIIRFGVVSDCHFGSHFTQIGLLHEAYDFFKAEGVADIYNPGDLTEGENMRQGHAYECYVHGADAHTDEVVKNYPQRDGITTHYILGNQDLSFMKHVGLDISRQISALRPDMVSLGIEQAYVKLTPNCLLELRHPSSGSAYAISYKPQKIIESMSGGEKPNMLLLGHFHKAEYLPYRNVHCVQAGTTQAQSNFMRNNNLAAHVGYWLIELRVDDEGQINRFRPEFMPCYKAVKDDWKNYR